MQGGVVGLVVLSLSILRHPTTLPLAVCCLTSWGATRTNRQALRCAAAQADTLLLITARSQRKGFTWLTALCHLRWLPHAQEALSPFGPQPSPTSLAALLNHPDCGGVFQLYQEQACSRNRSSSSSLSVDLVNHKLRRMAARGLVEAVAATWPGEGPLPRLRRAAALALACEYDGEPGTATCSRSVSGQVLAGWLREQLGEQAVPHPVELLRRIAEGDETELFAVTVWQGVSAGSGSRRRAYKRVGRGSGVGQEAPGSAWGHVGVC